MSLLRKSKSAPRRNILLLLAAVLLLAAPCAAAASFALRLDIYPEAPLGLSPSAAQQTQSRKQDQTEATLKQLQQLPEQAQGAADSKRAEIEDRLGEAQNNLKPQQQLLQQYDQTKGFAVLAEVAQAYQKSLMDATGQETDQKARLIRKVEPQYPDDARARGIEGTVVLAFTIDRDGVPQNIVVKGSLDPVLDQAAVAAVRQWRFEPALRDGQPVAKTVTVEVYFNPDPSRMQQQSDERARALERELVERARKQQQEIEQFTATQDKEAYEKAKDQFRELQERTKTLDDEMRARRAWDEAQNNYQGDVLRAKQSQLKAELEREDRLRGAGLDAAKWAKITITQAIQIATSKYPGTVVQARLFGERADQVFYQIMIANGDDINYVWVSAIDGQITKTEAAKRRRE